MPVYPLAKKVESYKTVASCKFGASREDGIRKHARVDLGIGAGSSVYAITSGTVDVVIRYGEVDIVKFALNAGRRRYNCLGR